MLFRSKGTLLVSMSGCPALAAPAGFSARGLPIGIQLIAPNRQEFACLQLAQAYESLHSPVAGRRSPLLDLASLSAGTAGSGAPQQ